MGAGSGTLSRWAEAAHAAGAAVSSAAADETRVPHVTHAGASLPAHFLRSKKLLGAGLEPARYCYQRILSPLSTARYNK